MRKAESLLVCCKEISLEVIMRKWYVHVSFMKCGTKSYINMDNISFENVAKFKYLGMRITDKNYTHEEVNSRCNYRMCPPIQCGILWPPFATCKQ
jgi:hypothetical protein